MKLSPAARLPVRLYVRAGSVAPYALPVSSAVTVIGRVVIVKSAPTNVIA